MKFSRFKTAYTLAFIIWANLIGYGQTSDNSQLKYVDILPPSPAVANLGAFNRPDVGLIAGTAQFSVPLASIDLPGFTLPVGISYSSNGVKVDEIASRVGLGWQLEAGGAITRSIQGKGPDERTILKRPPNTDVESWDYIHYLRDMVNSTGNTDSPDGEYDIFSFSFAGRTGKFILDDGDGTQNLNRIVMLDKQNLKIIKAPNFNHADYTFIIRDDQGNDFYFGGDGYKETTKRMSTCSNKFGNLFETTAWFLRKVVLYSGGTVYLNYSSVPTHKYDMGLSQTMNFNYPIVEGHQCNCPQNPLYDNCISYNEVNTKTLSSIEARGKTILFEYKSRLDNGDRLLERITISSPGFGFQEVFELIYNEENTNGFSPTGLAIETNITHRPYLSKIEKVGSSRLLYYQFDYNDPSQLPTRLSLAQDHWGYFNGQPNQWFVPKPAYQYRSQFPFALANRENSNAHNQYGMLNKITYPTGGYDLINYETNSNWEERPVYPTEQSTFNDNLYINNYDKDGTETLMGTILIEFEQEVSFTLKSTKDINRPITPDDIGKIRVELVGGGNVINTSLPSGQHPNGNSIVSSAYLTTGTYRIYLTAMGDHNTTESSLTYVPGPPTLVTKNWEIGGLRVAAIHSYSNQSNAVQIKKIKYGNSTYPDRSIAVKRYTPNYFTGKSFTYVCPQTYGVSGGTVTACVNYDCSFYSMSSSSITNLYNPSGNTVAYPTVIEILENSSGINLGMTEHQFNVVNDDYGSPILGSAQIGGQQSNFSLNGHGKELVTTYSGSSGPIKIVRNFYSLHPQVTELFDAYVINSLYTTGCTLEYPNPRAGNKNFEVTKYALRSLVPVLDSTVQETFDQTVAGAVFRTHKKFIYSDTSTLKPTLVKTTDSMGKALKTYNYYTRTAAGQIAGTQATLLNSLANKNVDNLVLQTTMSEDDYVGGFAIDHTWAGNIYPNKVKSYVQEGVEAKSFTILSRDTYSNVTERVDDSGVKECYIWDYDQTLPVAKISNANLSDVAFTSFETSALGNWSSLTNAILVSDETTPSGQKCITLNAGNLYKSGLNTTLKYRLLVWVKSGSSLTINSGGTILEQTIVMSRNGWTLTNYLLSTTGVIQISGTGSIDEIRLHPENALMVTNTYEPLIGPTASFDANGFPTFYSYDEFKRLKTVRDHNGALLTNYRYNLITNPTIIIDP